MKRLSATTLISVGAFLSDPGAHLTAEPLGLVPNQGKALLKGQAQIATLTAAQCSAAGGDHELMAASLAAVAADNPELLSAALRRADGAVTFAIGDHPADWAAPANASLELARIHVPLFANAEPWGQAEFRFRHAGGRAGGLLGHPMLRLGAFVAAASF
jgi:hypothetical protein